MEGSAHPSKRATAGAEEWGSGGIISLLHQNKAEYIIIFHKEYHSQKMVAKQRIRMANEKHSKNITQRGNVAKTLVRRGFSWQDKPLHRWRGMHRIGYMTDVSE